MKKGTPPIKMYFSPKHYNVLMNKFDFFIDSEKKIGETIYSKTAKALKEKIMKYARVYYDDSDDTRNVMICFFQKEALSLIDLLVTYAVTQTNDKNLTDYFSKITLKTKKYNLEVTE
jgi:hypothetical protein